MAAEKKGTAVALNPNSLNMKGMSIRQIKVGQKASFSRTIEAADVHAFAGIICDFNPVHMNAEYAKQTRFGRRIAHGMLTASHISTVVGMCIPGADAIYLGQTLKFTAPVYFGDTITVEAEVTKVEAKRKIAYLSTIIKNQNGTVVLEGEATVMATKK